MPLYNEANSKIDNSLKASLERKKNYYLDSLKVKKDILYNVMFSRRITALSEDNVEEDYKDLKQHIDNKDIIEIMDRCYNTKYKKEKYAKVEFPDGVAKDFFNSISAPHKGKIVLVDFWATTCGPCVSGIKKMAELRDRLKGKDISFVFITDKGSSPIKRYEEIMKDVDGYKHYNENDEMNHMRALFKFIGIPRYVLVDKDGDVIDTDFSIYTSLDFTSGLEYTFNQLIDSN